ARVVLHQEDLHHLVAAHPRTSSVSAAPGTGSRGPPSAQVRPCSPERSRLRSFGRKPALRGLTLPAGQREPHDGAAAGRRLDPDAALVVLDDPLDEGQADAAARVLLARVQALEDDEDTL